MDIRAVTAGPAFGLCLLAEKVRAAAWALLGGLLLVLARLVVAAARGR